MIPFVLAGLATATVIAKQRHDAKRAAKLDTKTLPAPAPAPAPQITQEQAHQIIQAIYFMRKDIEQLQDEMKTKVTFH